MQYWFVYGHQSCLTNLESHWIFWLFQKLSREPLDLRAALSFAVCVSLTHTSTSSTCYRSKHGLFWSMLSAIRFEIQNEGLYFPHSESLKPWPLCVNRMSQWAANGMYKYSVYHVSFKILSTFFCEFAFHLCAYSASLLCHPWLSSINSQLSQPTWDQPSNWQVLFCFIHCTPKCSHKAQY